jgi:tryptophan halogenase
MTTPVRRVVIVGRDAALWLSALALQRAFGRAGVQVTAVELPSYLRPADVFPTTPTLQNLHRLLGLPESQVLTAAAGVYSLGQRFSNWSKSQAGFLYAYDTQGAPFESVDFLHYWLRARSLGLKVQLEDFSLGALAAKHGRFVLHNEDTEAISKATYGYNLNAAAYVQLIRHHALSLGVTGAKGFVGPRAEGGRIVGVAMADGSVLEGDLFVDASGADAVLLGRLGGPAFEAWSHWFGCDRVLAASGPRLTPLPGFSEIAAIRSGWYGLYPLQDRTALICAYDSRQTPDEDMAQTVAVLAGMQLKDLVVSPIRHGMRPTPWVGNCIAIGDAAVALEPLDAVGLHLIQVGVSHLIDLFPTDAETMPEAKAYNEAVTGHYRSVRDFQLAHYKLNQRFDEPFWDRARSMTAPEQLQYRIDLFGRCGRAPIFDNETTETENWTALFIGHGLIPARWDPLVERVPEGEQIDSFKKILSFLAAEVQSMPSIEAQLELDAPQPGGSLF